MNKDILDPNENTILIGHSLGGFAFLKYLEKLPGIEDLFWISQNKTLLAFNIKINKVKYKYI